MKSSINVCAPSQRGSPPGLPFLLLLGILSCQAASGLLWLPGLLPAGSEPAAIACPTSASCIAVGQAGLVLGSTNNGVAWYPEVTGLGSALVNFNLTSIACLSSSVCTIVGNQGLILGSTNGGQNFSIQNVTTNGNLTLNEVVCQSTGTPSCAIVGDNNTLLLQTSAGGAWTPDLSVLQAAIGPANFDQVALLGSSLWISASTTSGTGLDALLYSGDSGTTWTLEIVPQVLAPQGISGVGCTSTSTCYVDGPGTLLETTDGGGLWSPVFLPGSGAGGTAPSFTGIYVGPGATVFAYGSQGALVQVSTLTSGAVTGPAGMPQTLPSAGLQLTLGGMTCPLALTCYVAGYSLAISGEIFYSSPIGATSGAVPGG